MADDNAETGGDEQVSTDVPSTGKHQFAADVQARRDPPEDRWVESLSDPLPGDLRDALERFLGSASVETLADWATQIRKMTGGGAIDVEDLCHTSDQTSHYGETADERYYFACFYDAVVLAALTDAHVDIHTESPDGAVVEASVDETGAVTPSPSTAVFSLGVSDTATVPDDRELTHGDVYAAVCPYVRAFPDVEAYEEWAADAAATTVAVPLGGATGFTDALVE